MKEMFTPGFTGPSLKQILKIEFTSWFGRNFRKGKSKIKIVRKPLLLDIGCGSNFKDGWVHVDFFQTPRLKFWKKYPPTESPDVETDLRYPLKCEDNSVDGVYSGHTIEHLFPSEAYQLLCEVFRILKPGCWLRINCPDIEKYVNFYLGKELDPKFSKFKSGCEAICTITQDYGHHSCWDEQLMTKALSNVGFMAIKKVKFATEGSDPRLIKEEDVRSWETLVMEAQKPF